MGYSSSPLQTGDVRGRRCAAQRRVAFGAFDRQSVFAEGEARRRPRAAGRRGAQGARDVDGVTEGGLRASPPAPNGSSPTAGTTSSRSALHDVGGHICARRTPSAASRAALVVLVIEEVLWHQARNAHGAAKPAPRRQKARRASPGASRAVMSAARMTTGNARAPWPCAHRVISRTPSLPSSRIAAPREPRRAQRPRAAPRQIQRSRDATVRLMPPPARRDAARSPGPARRPGCCRQADVRAGGLSSSVVIVSATTALIVALCDAAAEHLEARR